MCYLNEPKLMKNIMTKQKWMGLIIIMICSAFSQERAYDCKAYLPEKEGTKLSYETMNHKDKVLSRHTLTVKSIKEHHDTVYYTVDMEQTDKKGKETLDQELTMKCSEGRFFFDMESFIPAEAKEVLSQQQVDMQIDSDYLALPSKLSEGMELEDGKIEMSLSMGNTQLLSINVERYNRQVKGKETITVPAGTFECWKVTSDIRTKSFGKTEATSAAEWYKSGVGLIKSENYDKKGKLESYQQLTEVVN